MAAVDEFVIGAPDDLDRDAPGADAGDDRTEDGRRRAGGPALWVVAAVVLVAVGAAAAGPASLVVGRGAGAEVQVADLALAAPPDVVWRSDVPVDVAGTTATTLVARTWEQDGAEEAGFDLGTDDRAVLLGLDLATGAERWRHPDNGSCQVGPAGAACVEPVAAADAEVVVLADDGTERRVPYPGAVGALPVEGGLVVVESAGLGVDEAVVLLDGEGSERWRVRADAADDLRSTYLYAVDGVLHLGLSGQRFDLAAGAELTGPALSGPGGEQVPGAGATVRTETGDVVLGESEVAGRVDDDLGGPVALVQEDEDTVVAQLRDDGQELWRTDAASCAVTARLAGVVLAESGCRDDDLGGSGSLTALDEVTGEELWSDRCWCSVVHASEDGTAAVLDWAGPELTGVDLRTGETLWAVPGVGEGGSAGTWSSGRPLDDGYVLASADGLTVWRWTD